MLPTSSQTSALLFFPGWVQNYWDRICMGTMWSPTSTVWALLPVSWLAAAPHSNICTGHRCCYRSSRALPPFLWMPVTSPVGIQGWRTLAQEWIQALARVCSLLPWQGQWPARDCKPPPQKYLPPLFATLWSSVCSRNLRKGLQRAVCWIMPSLSRWKSKICAHCCHSCHTLDSRSHLCLPEQHGSSNIIWPWANTLTGPFDVIQQTFLPHQHLKLKKQRASLPHIFIYVKNRYRKESRGLKPPNCSILYTFQAVSSWLHWGSLKKMCCYNCCREKIEMGPKRKHITEEPWNWKLGPNVNHMKCA